MKHLQPLIENHDKILFTCLNDKIDHDLASAEAVENGVKNDFYEVLFPTPSKFEKSQVSVPTTRGTTTTVAKTEKTMTEKVEETEEEDETTTNIPTTTIKKTTVHKTTVKTKDSTEEPSFSEMYEVAEEFTDKRTWSNVIAFYIGGTTMVILIILKIRRKFR